METDLALADIDEAEKLDAVGDIENGLGDVSNNKWSNSSQKESDPGGKVSMLSDVVPVAAPRRLSRKEILAKQSVIAPVSIQHELMNYRRTEFLEVSLCQDLYRMWSIGYLKVFLFWTTWMAIGTTFYAIRNDLGWKKGFYMMINVGYSIGWGYPIETDRKGLWFSIMNVFVGAMALSYFLRVFAITVMSDSKSWYAKALYERKMLDTSISIWEKIKEVTKNHRKKLINIGIFFLWVCIGVCWSTYVFDGWMFVEGLYFTVSSLSTGGLYPIPQDASDNAYVIVGVFTAIGVPLMGLAMADLTRMLLKFGDPEKAKDEIRAKITEEELNMLSKYGMDDRITGDFTRTEFIILSLLRLRVLTPSALDEINKRFNTMDIAGSGFLKVDDIVNQSRSRSISRIFRKSNLTANKRARRKWKEEQLEEVRRTLTVTS